MKRYATGCLPLLLAALGCGSPVVVVEVQNPQGLTIAREHVTADWTDPDGHIRSVTHDFAVNGNLGTFAIELRDPHDGRLRITVDLLDAVGAPVGRASTTLPLDGAGRTDVKLRATRLLAGVQLATLAGVPGGPGDRNGSTGPNTGGVARLDRPIGFTRLGFNNLPGTGGAFVLEACGAIRQLVPAAAGATNVLAPFVPCSRHTPEQPSGKVSELSLDDPTAIIGDPFGPTLYVGDGHRVVAITLVTGTFDPAVVDYVDFTGRSGLSPQHVADVALGSYELVDDALAPPYTTLFVADDVANVVWAYPLAGGLPSAVVGTPGPCVMPLPAGEQPGSAFVAPAAAHLCHPTQVDAGALAGKGSDAVLFVGDRGHGAVRMLAPNGLGAGAPGVTTLFGGVTSLRTIGYRYLGVGSALPGTELGALLFVDGDRLGLFTLFANPTVALAGQAVMLNDQPAGYTERFDLRAAIAGAAMGQPAHFQLDDVVDLYRVRDLSQEGTVGNTLFDLIQRGNSVVSRVALDLTVEPWVGAGPHRDLDRPTGLAWNGASTLFVADRDRLVAVDYDPAKRPLAGGQISPVGPLDDPRALAFDPSSTTLYFVDAAGTSVRALQVGSLAGATVLAPGTLPFGALALDPIRRQLWASRPGVLTRVDLDSAPAETSLALPAGFVAAPQLALADTTLWIIDPSGAVATVDLLAKPPIARPAGALALGGAVTAAGTDGEWLYVADTAARLWRIDPHDPALAPSLIAGDGVRGVVLGAVPGLNTVGGIAYDAQKGVLLLSDPAENVVISLQ